MLLLCGQKIACPKKPTALFRVGLLPVVRPLILPFTQRRAISLLPLLSLYGFFFFFGPCCEFFQRVISIPLATLMCLHNKAAPVQGRHPLLVVLSVITFLVFVTAVLLERFLNSICAKYLILLLGFIRMCTVAPGSWSYL